MTWKIYTAGGRRERRWVPVMHDLLFVYSSRDVIDPIVERVSTFQYRFTRNSHHEPMVVRTEDMERFMGAKVYLETWVKVKENWRDNVNFIRSVGYDEE